MTFGLPASGRVFILALLSLLQGYLTSAQVLHGVIAEPVAADLPMHLERFYGTELIPADSCTVGKNGSFRFHQTRYPAGLYLLSLSDTGAVTLILNPEEPETELYFGGLSLEKDAAVLKSKENQLFFLNKELGRYYRKTRSRLLVTRSWLKPDDLSGKAAIDSLVNRTEAVHSEEVLSLAKRYPETWFSKLAVAQQIPARGQTTRYFSNLDFSDATLLHSTVFPSRILDFLLYHTTYDETGFRNSIDTIMNLASANPEVRNYCRDYLLNLFDRTGPTVIFQYLVENYYLPEGCREEIHDTLLKEKILAYRNLLPGSSAPEVMLPNSAGTRLSLRETSSQHDYTLVFFWSSHCPFCKTALPRLDSLVRQIGKRGINTAVYSVSLDPDLQQWHQTLRTLPAGWIQTCDGLGWESPAVQDWKVGKTPSFFIIDRRGIILHRSANTTDLKDYFDRKAKDRDR